MWTYSRYEIALEAARWVEKDTDHGGGSEKRVEGRLKEEDDDGWGEISVENEGFSLFWVEKVLQHIERE